MCTAKRLLGLGAPDSVRCARLASVNWLLSGLRRRRTAKIHQTVRCAPDCPVSQQSARPTVGRVIRARRVAEPTVRRGTGLSGVHQTVSGAPTALNRQRRLRQRRKEIRTGQCPVVHRLSGAPGDRRQELPSWNALNGS
jgi:hypothetical protein